MSNFKTDLENYLKEDKLKIDQYSIDQCVWAYHQMIEAMTEVEENGRVQKFNKGTTSNVSGWLTAYGKAEKSFMDWCTKLGLTPADRKKLNKKVEPKVKKKDAIGDLIEK